MSTQPSISGLFQHAWLTAIRCSIQQVKSIILGIFSLSLLGCYANPYYDPQQAHHTESGFQNPEETPKLTQSSWDWLGFYWQMYRLLQQPVEVPSDHRVSPAQAKQQWYANSADDKLVWLGHASFLLQTAGQTLLTDPFFSDYASPFTNLGPKRFTAPGLAIADLPPIDLILISHDHYDHLDTAALQQLAQHSPQAHVIVPLGLADLLREQGFSQVSEGDWWQRFSHQSLTITVTPAVHFSRRGLFDQNRSLWAGFSIQSPSLATFFAGDTGYGEVFNQIGQTLGPFDLALLPIGAYAPRHFMAPVHLSPEEAGQVAQDTQSTHAVGMHWGTIRLTLEPVLEPEQRWLAQTTSSFTPYTLTLGQTYSLVQGRPILGAQ